MLKKGIESSELNIDDESAAQYTRATDCISQAAEPLPAHPQQPESISYDTDAHEFHQHQPNQLTRSAAEYQPRRDSNQLPDATASITAALHRSDLSHDPLHTPPAQSLLYPGHNPAYHTQQLELDGNSSDAGRGYYFTGYVDSNGTLLYTMPIYDMFTANTITYPALLHPGENTMAGQGATGVHSAPLAQTPTSPMRPPSRIWPQDLCLPHHPAGLHRRSSEPSYAEYPAQHNIPHHPFAAPYPYMYYPQAHVGVMQPVVAEDPARNPMPNIQPEPLVAAYDRDTSLESETPDDLSPLSSDQVNWSLTSKSQSNSPQTSKQTDRSHRRHHSFDWSRSLNRYNDHRRSQKAVHAFHERRRSSESAPTPAHPSSPDVRRAAKNSAKVTHHRRIEVPGQVSSGYPSPKTLDSERSRFVMWCGNVSADASQEELWQFFTQTADSVRSSDTPMQIAPQDTHGVVSIFIMSRSNCAFVNFSSARHLDRACSLFHNTKLRSKLRSKPSNIPLVCRARRSEDVEHAGVAAQRGKGVHTSWYRKEKQLQKQNQTDASDAPPSSNSSDSLSFSSTDSSLLGQPQFAHRFFILKSRNSEALNTALRTNIWCTQPHNEPVLDQAFRNSETVTLLFSENHSGHFFGYATMASRIGAACCTEDRRSNYLPASPESNSCSATHQRSQDASEDLVQINSSTANTTQPNDDDLPTNASSSPSPFSPTCEADSRSSRPFYIRWVKTEPLPFRNINKLRNPWRDNRLVKVSRDGTELEPYVGSQLLSIWESLT